MTAYDSTQDTLDHIQKVREALATFRVELAFRADAHDASKLQEPEKSLFDKYTPLLKATTYGSEEYKQYLKEMGAALQHHYANNSHHPEYWPIPESEAIDLLRQDLVWCEYDHTFPELSSQAGQRLMKQLSNRLKELESRVNGMDLLDIVEMFCDWYAASQRHNDGSLEKSLPINAERFELAPQLVDIFENTRRNLGWK